MEAGRADLAAAEESEDALRRANADLAASRAALRESEERLRLILASATDYAILTTGLDRRVATWNAGAERLLGWSAEEVVGRSADIIFTPEDRGAGAPEREAEGALRDGRAVDERWHVRKDGSRFWGSGLAMPLRDPEAEAGAPPLGLLKVMRDRTEQRRAEEAMRGSERRLRLLADTAAGLLAADDPDEVLRPVFRALSGEFGLDISFSYVTDEAADGGGLRLASCFGVPEEARPVFERLAPGEGVCGRAARDRRAVHVADARASDDPATAPLRALRVRAYAAFPLRAGGGRLLGTLSFGSRRRARFSEEELAFLGTIAHHVAVVRERLRAEASLRGSEARFRALSRASSDVLYRMSPDWSEMRQLSGGGFIADAPSPRRGWMEDYIHPDDRPLVAEAIRQAIGSKGVFELEHRVRRPDGGLGWTLSRAVPILGADGGVVEWFGAASDVTARRDAEERLRASEARWRGLFGSMQEGFAYCEMVYDAEGRAVDYRHLELNAAWGRLTGVPNEEVQGKLVSEAIPGIEPFWLETYARVVETGEPAHFEHRLAVYGRWFEVMAYRTEPGRFAAVFSNITERKAAEARRDALVELGDCLRDLRDPAEIARTAAEVIGRALGAVRAGYGTVDAAGEVFRIERCWTDGRAPGVAGELRVADFWADLAAEHGRGGVVAIDDAARDPRTAGRAGAYAALGLRAFLDVPVVEAGRVAAILFVHDASPRAWTAEEVAFARGAADRAWAAAVRARAEAALREGERRLQATQDHAGVGITEIDAEGRYARVNQTYARLSGWAAVDLAGRAYWDLIEDGGGREEARRDFGRLVRGEVDGLDARREYTGRCGRRWWAEITARAIRDERGRFLYAVRVVQDITERKRAEDALRDGERRLRATQDHAGVGIHEVDAEGRYARVSATFTRMTGYTVEDLAGRSTWDLIEDEADRREARAAFARLVRGEADGTTERRAYTDKLGRRWWAEVTTTAVRDEGGRFLWAVRVLHDITERKRAEERRSLLVNELNHRVKNTLAVVQSLAAQTARGAADLPAFSAAFQARLVALARAHDLLTREDWAGAPLHAVARAALEPLAAGSARVDLSACASAGAVLPPPQALALALALHELATNALKHGALSAPGGRVSVSCGTDPEDASTVVEWTERGGPPAAGPPARRGFGLRLLASQAGVAADLRFEPEGVRCALRLPHPPTGSRPDWT